MGPFPTHPIYHFSLFRFCRKGKGLFPPPPCPKPQNRTSPFCRKAACASPGASLFSALGHGPTGLSAPPYQRFQLFSAPPYIGSRLFSTPPRRRLHTASTPPPRRLHAASTPPPRRLHAFRSSLIPAQPMEPVRDPQNKTDLRPRTARRSLALLCRRSLRSLNARSAPARRPLLDAASTPPQRRLDAASTPP